MAEHDEYGRIICSDQEVIDYALNFTPTIKHSHIVVEDAKEQAELLLRLQRELAVHGY